MNKKKGWNGSDIFAESKTHHKYTKTLNKIFHTREQEEDHQSVGIFINYSQI